MGKYQAYPEYKDSGVEWIGQIPLDWDTAKFGRACFMQEGPGLRTWQFTDSGTRVICVTNITEYGIDFPRMEKFISTEEYLSSYQHFTVANGDLLLSSSGNSWGKVAEFQGDESVILNTSTIRVNESAERKLSKGFIKWFLQSTACKEQLGLAMTGSCQPNFGPSHLKQIFSALPPAFVQQKIANFLDHETAKIDTLIEKQQQLIQLLKEKRQAVISHAVTKGLNPNVPMKDSGVEWLGEVPEHWVICAIKYVLSSQDSRRIPLSSEERGERSGDYRYYGASGVIDYIDDYIFDDESTVLVGEDGANLVSRNTPLAFAAHGKYWVNNHAHILKPKDSLADYWAEVIEHIDVNPIVTGSAQPKLTAEALNNLIIAFPINIDEKTEIDLFIKLQKGKYQNLIDKAQLQIELMQERRTALISAAVTGKIDVRNWQAPQN